MDVANKTLSQLSKEAKEKHFITLETGAKISGYTKDYLERLCRLNKVEYRLRGNGDFVIEIDSLLRETHTILLSYADITFVDLSEVVDSLEQNVAEVLLSTNSGSTFPENISETNREAKKMFSQKNIQGITQQVPNFGMANHVASRIAGKDAFSFVGRAVVSDSLHPETNEDKDIHVPVISDTERKSIAGQAQATTPTHSPVHLAINRDNANTVNGGAVLPKTASEPIHLSVMRDTTTPTSVIPEEKSPHDEWDASLLAGETPKMDNGGNRSLPSGVTSALHPIQTAIDGSVHHDNAPLFPMVEKIISPTPTKGIPIVPPMNSTPGIPDLGPEKRVIVFSSSNSPVGKKEDAMPMMRSGISASALVEEESVNPSVSLLFPKDALPVKENSRVLASSPSRTIERVLPKVPEQKKQQLLSVPAEQHLVLRKEFPLAKSIPFNIAFVVCLLMAVATLLPNSPVSIFNKPISYVASVAGSDITHSDTEKQSSPGNVVGETGVLGTTLPFSDDIHVATGTTPNSVEVSPVFNGAEGDPIEYIIRRAGESE